MLLMKGCLQLLLGLRGDYWAHLRGRILIAISREVCALLRRFLNSFDWLTIVYVLLFMLFVVGRQLAIYRSLLCLGYYHLSLTRVIAHPCWHLMVI